MKLATVSPNENVFMLNLKKLTRWWLGTCSVKLLSVLITTW